MLSTKSSSLLKNIAVNVIKSVRNHGHIHYGSVGENLPFSLGNRYKLTAYFTLYIGSGLSVPYMMVRYHLTKH